MDRRLFLALGGASSLGVALPARGALRALDERGTGLALDPFAAPAGLETGWSGFDELTGGLHPSDLVVVGGRPGMGKTTFALNIVEHTIMTNDRPVAMFSMETPAEHVRLRMIGSLGYVERRKLRYGTLDERDRLRVASAVATLDRRNNLHIDDTPALTPAKLAARARRLADERGLGLIVVDYVQLMMPSSPRPGRPAEIEEIARSLKALAEELNVPIVALSQLNRTLEQRPDRRPVLSDLRESRALAEHADVVAFVYRHEVYEPGHESSRGRAEILVRKQRDRPPGRVDLTFRAALPRFEDWPPRLDGRG